MASRHVSVVLSGDGGTRRLLAMISIASALAARLAHLPAALRRTLARRLLAPLQHDSGGGTTWLLTQLAHALLPYAEAIFYPEFFDGYGRTTLYQPWVRAASLTVPHDGSACFAGLDHLDDPVDLMQWLDYQWYLPGDLLVKMDMASMACSLEPDPVLDHRVIEFCAALPSAVKPMDVSEIVLREAFRAYYRIPSWTVPSKVSASPARLVAGP